MKTPVVNLLPLLFIMISSLDAPSHAEESLTHQAPEATTPIITLDQLDRQFLQKGMEQMRKDSPGAAVSSFTSALKLKPDNYEVRYLRAAALAEAGSPGEAVKELDLILEKQPSSEAFELRGRLRLAHGDLRDALEDFEHCQEIYIKQNELDDAQRVGGKAADALVEEAAKAGFRKDYSLSRKMYSCAIAFNPRSAKAYCGRARVLHLQGSDPGAICDLEKALSLAPLYDLAYFERGNLRYAMGAYSEAEKDLDTAISIDPLSGDAYYVRALCRAAQGNASGAMEDYGAAEKAYKAQRDTDGIARVQNQITAFKQASS